MKKLILVLCFAGVNFLWSHPVTVNWVSKIQPDTYAEIGIGRGDTVYQIAKVLPQGSEIYIFDREIYAEEVRKGLLARGYDNVHTFSNTDRIKDSYNWSLMKLLQEHDEPIFDYVYLDGSHTWEIDGFAFFLVDKLLKPGGYIEFDDYDWTFMGSPTVNPQVCPLVLTLHSDEQLRVPHVKLVVDLLVKTHPDYVEVLKDRIYQKIQ